MFTPHTTKEVHREKLEAQLHEIDAQIEQWRAKWDQAEADAKIEFHEQLEDLEKQRAELQEQIEAWDNAGEDAWEDIKNAASNAWDNLKNTFDKLAARFNQS